MLALFIFVKPSIQVKLVKYTAPSDFDNRDVQLGEQRHPDPEIGRCLFLGETPSCGQRQAVFFHVAFSCVVLLKRAMCLPVLPALPKA